MNSVTTKSENNSLRFQYVLITPARNEEAFIELTLQSVVAQTCKPLKWVIVSDGSTDATDEIVQRYTAKHHWIELIRMPERKERHFAGKVNAFNAGYARVSELKFEVVGNLDGDVSFDPDYMSYLLDKFGANLRLGVAGTNRWEGSFMYDYRFSSIEDVAGACQLFRRACFEEIGGYTPVKGGGIDLIAMLTARMRGWETRNFTDKYLIHHRPSGTASRGKWLVHFNDGRKDYMFGTHPLWELFRGIYRMSKRPFLIGGFLLLAGYNSSFLRRINRPISAELIRFRRSEQMRRLGLFLTRPLSSPSQKSS